MIGSYLIRSLPLLSGLVLFFLAVAVPARSAEFFLSDEPEVYAAIDKLNALGHLPGFLANTRPYSMQAVRAAAAAASRTSIPGEFDRELLQWLVSYSEPKTMGRVTVGGSHSDARFLPPNNEGIPRPEGWAAQGSIALREESSPYLSGQLRAAFFRGEGGDEGNRLLDTSIEAGYKYASLQAGKISTWYGPGRNGALILTNNAAPYPGVRLHNPEPIPLTGWSSFLGNVQYDLFVARMEKKEMFSRSLFVGTRLAARPKPWLEIGLTRALHYGGDGRSNGLSEFLTDYGGNNDPPDRSNTLTGFDLAVTLPFRFQPVQIYWERAGEGRNRLLGDGNLLPSQLGNLLGLYFPKVLGESRLDLRAEYADNYSGDAKSADWYSHPAYPHFYRGNVLGHPMGGGSRDWFFESRYFFGPSSFASVSFERILHDRGVQPSIGFPGERRSRISGGLIGWLAESWRGEAHVSADRVTDRGSIPGTTGTDISAWLAISYQTSRINQ